MNYAVIMAGGSGTRLWPLSRQCSPKQALRLVGERTMFQHAVDRLAPLFPPERILVVTAADHAAILAGQTPQIPVENFLAEPEGRGTAAAIGLAAIHLASLDSQAVMAVLTADHHITDTPAFRHVLSAACQLARQGRMVTLGIKPTAPFTGYGYIQQGESAGTSEELAVYRVRRFVEKPNLEVAVEMVASGQYSWNSGMFIWSVGAILGEFARQMPEFFGQLRELSAALGTERFPAALQRIWPQVKKQTIDYGIMEGAKDVLVIPAEFGWTDIGSWSSLYGLLPADEQGNIFTGPHLALDTRGTLAFAEKRLVALIGLEDMIIVDTPDALLICPKGREQEVREIVRRLGEEGQEKYL